MKKFEFSSGQQQTVAEATPFTGFAFYNIYKNAEFLRNSDNIETILSKGHELRQMLKDARPGEIFMVQGMNLERMVPLLVKKTGKNINVENFEFTHNRLTGLVAAYAFENRLRFHDIKSSEAIALGLTWDHCDVEKSRLYLSAVTGTEHFYDQFRFWPLVCAMRKLQLQKITLDPVIKMAKKKNNDGERMAKEFKKNGQVVKRLWKHFPGSSYNDLKVLQATTPPQLKRIFADD